MSHAAGSESHGRGYTPDVDDPEYQGSAFANAVARTHLQAGWAQAEAYEARDRRNDALKACAQAEYAFVESRKRYDHQWSATRWFSIVRLIAVALAVTAYFSGSWVAGYLAGCCLVPCLFRDFQVLFMRWPGFVGIPPELLDEIQPEGTNTGPVTRRAVLASAPSHPAPSPEPQAADRAQVETVV